MRVTCKVPLLEPDTSISFWCRSLERCRCWSQLPALRFGAVARASVSHFLGAGTGAGAGHFQGTAADHPHIGYIPVPVLVTVPVTSI